MLSDIFKSDKLETNDFELKTKIQRLENLSISMSNLIASGNSDKIIHLDKIRKKILTDILKTKELIPQNKKIEFKNLINLNNELVEKMKEEKVQTLKKIKNKIKFYKANQYS
tara:strand:- start:81 stop:416 length:336 start_codon:yes stop_codon:yes gene_type:complete